MYKLYELYTKIKFKWKVKRQKVGYCLRVGHCLLVGSWEYKSELSIRSDKSSSGKNNSGQIFG